MRRRLSFAIALAFVLSSTPSRSEHSPLPFLEPILFQQAYGKGDIEQAAALIGTYGALLENIVMGESATAEHIVRRHFTDTISLALSGAEASPERALEGARLFFLLYGEKKYATAFLPSYQPILSISTGLAKGLPDEGSGGQQVAYFWRIYQEVDPELRPIVGYAMSYYLTGDWRNNRYLHHHDQAGAWIAEHETDPFFVSCIRFAYLASEAQTFADHDPLKLESVDWAAWDGQIGAILPREGPSARIQLLGAASLLVRANPFVNLPAFMERIRELLRSEEASCLWPTSQPLHIIANSCLRYPANEKGIAISAGILADRIELMRAFEARHEGQLTRDVNEIDQLVIGVSRLEQMPDLDFLLENASELEGARCHPGLVLALLCDGRINQAKELLPANDEIFTGPLGGRFTRRMEQGFNILRATVRGQAMRLQLDALLLRHLLCADTFHPPVTGEIALTDRLLSDQEHLADLSAPAAAQVVGSLGSREIVEPHLDHLCRTVISLGGADLDEIKDDDLQEVWTSFHATRLKALFLTQNWTALDDAMDKAQKLAARNPNAFYALWKKFGRQIAWPTTLLLVEKKPGYDLERMAQALFRATAIGCAHGYHNNTHKNAFYSYGRIALFDAGITFEEEMVKRHLLSHRGQRKWNEFRSMTSYSRWSYKALRSAAWHSDDWRVAGTRHSTQKRFYSALLKREDWIGWMIPQGLLLNRYRHYKMVETPMLQEIYEQETLGPRARFLLAWDGGIYHEGNALGADRRVADLQSVVDQLEDSVHPGDIQILPRCYLTLAIEKRAAGDRDAALALLEKVSPSFQEQLAPLVDRIREPIPEKNTSASRLTGPE